VTACSVAVCYHIQNVIMSDSACSVAVCYHIQNVIISDSVRCIAALISLEKYFIINGIFCYDLQYWLHIQENGNMFLRNVGKFLSDYKRQ
jgi:hypothetical protein